MTITTDAAIEFFGTQDTLGTTSAAVADNAFSIAGDLSTWVNDDDAQLDAADTNGLDGLFDLEAEITVAGKKTTISGPDLVALKLFFIPDLIE